MPTLVPIGGGGAAGSEVGIAAVWDGAGLAAFSFVAKVAGFPFSEGAIVDAGARSSIDCGVRDGESLGDGNADGVTAAVALAGKDG